MTSHFASHRFVRLLATLFALTLIAKPTFAQPSPARGSISDNEPETVPDAPADPLMEDDAETLPEPVEEEDFALEDFDQDDSLASYDSYASAAPNMVGDFFGGGFSGGVIFDSVSLGTIPLPLAGGASRMKIAENNKALTQDRIIFQYNHYHNALEYPGLSPSQSLDQYVIGFEKRLFDGGWSIDIRMPFTSGAQLYAPDVMGVIALDAGNVGNLNVAIKRMIYQDCYRSMVVGLAVNTPTGSDVTGNVRSDYFTLHNDTVRLAPYIGAQLTPNQHTFIHGFLQADLTTSGNEVEVNGLSRGRLNEPSLLYADVSAGRWLYRDPCSGRGLAAMAELHLTTRLNDGTPEFSLFNGMYSVDGTNQRLNSVVNITGALQANLNRTTTLRIGAVFPISGENSPTYGRSDRLFDSEIMVQLNKFF